MVKTSESAPLVVILGETASGKSALALELAKRLNGEIVCADSWTVYKGFDIGTAKPSAREQQGIPHYLLDVTTADKGFSAPQFQRLALTAIEEITSRGKLPIMVGGTGLYIDSVVFNYSFLPASGNSERARLNNLSLEELLITAKKHKLPLESIDARNKRRVIRLIENGGKLPSKSNLRPNTLMLGLHVRREELRTRIESRVDKMLAQGLENEVRGLADRYGWSAEPMKGVGYREWQGYFDGAQSLQQVRARIIKASLDLAKKQRTWFRRPIYQSSVSSHNKSIHWISNSSNLDEIVDLVTTKLNNVF